MSVSVGFPAGIVIGLGVLSMTPDRAALLADKQAWGFRVRIYPSCRWRMMEFSQLGSLVIQAWVHILAGVSHGSLITTDLSGTGSL